MYQLATESNSGVSKLPKQRGFCNGSDANKADTDGRWVNSMSPVKALRVSGVVGVKVAPWNVFSNTPGQTGFPHPSWPSATIHPNVQDADRLMSATQRLKLSLALVVWLT